MMNEISWWGISIRRMRRLIVSCAVSVLVFFLYMTSLSAGDLPRLLVVAVPDAQFAAATNKLADLLIEQRAFPSTAKWRTWVMEGWRDYAMKDNPSAVVKVYCDSVQHLEEGGIKLTDERLDKMRSLAKGAAIAIEVTDDLSELMNKLGLQAVEMAEAPPTDEPVAGALP